MFVKYLAFHEYQELGGTAPEDKFTNLERKAQRLLDHITFDRVKLLDNIPDEVKEVLTEIINRDYDYTVQEQTSGNLSSYSNGVEKLVYSNTAPVKKTKEYAYLVYQYLPDYLVNRSVSFDVEKYLQSKADNS